MIVTDMTMPRANGLELFREIRSTLSDIPVILCTVYSEIIDTGDGNNLEISR